jgi:hypothetical protein
VNVLAFVDVQCLFANGPLTQNAVSTILVKFYHMLTLFLLIIGILKGSSAQYWIVSKLSGAGDWGPMHACVGQLLHWISEF